MNYSQPFSISRKSFATRLASALAFSMQIPDGTHLVAVLGAGDESSNLAALTHWVENELWLMDDEALQDPLPQLLNNLERLLLSAQEDFA
ncbi:hypothetical protein D777_03345 [Marinobacter nitratireducens]|uniref:Uncharacterized protein n=1 Tax=Marinobacter nitratireducens TaxID=1137280 RepID=A0A072MXN8_9GAMM|nr:hypothetical protein [Marinobacter nitratireducens]KEF30169.1 hypothetical protein D777_03345 [Marinobacter nitratireducens]